MSTIHRPIKRFVWTTSTCLIALLAHTPSILTHAQATQTTSQIQLEPLPDDQTQVTSTPIDIAILLDTSKSMDGLIDQAKQQLWTIVNQFAQAEKNNTAPTLRVALFEYGNTNLPASEGYIRQIVPLTDDLDKVSEKLFELTTQGGDEYCGQVIHEAVSRLDWNTDPNSYKSIFIAGNEPFTQGSVPYEDACKRAIEHGIVVNTIHCGSQDAGEQTGWKNGAEIAEGQSFNIDQDRAVVYVDAPQDPVIIKLNQELNTTYLWYGVDAQTYKANQIMQDSNANSFNASIMSQRALTKSSSAYRNFNRDLVDTFIENLDKLEQVKPELLPKQMQTMTPEERKAYISTMAAKRAEIQAQIKQVSEERKQFVANALAKLQESDKQDTLGDAVSQAIRTQLKNAGFSFNNPTASTP